MGIWMLVEVSSRFQIAVIHGVFQIIVEFVLQTGIAFPANIFDAGTCDRVADIGTQPALAQVAREFFAIFPIGLYNHNIACSVNV